VSRYRYPDVPVLRENLFRVAGGAGQFAAFVSAEYLMRWNTTRVSRDIHQAEAGDLLFYFNGYHAEAPYHSMIVTENHAGQVSVLYHTGGEAGIKRVQTDYLMRSPDARWRPVPQNESFLGVFRFHILD
jgi:hypothetical protein